MKVEISPLRFFPSSSIFLLDPDSMDRPSRYRDSIFRVYMIFVDFCFFVSVLWNGRYLLYNLSVKLCSISNGKEKDDKRMDFAFITNINIIMYMVIIYS